MEGTSRGTSKARVVVAAPGVAVTDATTTGVVVAAPHLRITWPLKVVDTAEAPVPSPLQVVSLSNLSSPIWLSNISFDVEDNHTSMTCPLGWHKPSHDMRTFTWDNAQTILVMGCNACTKGMHKTLLPRNF